MLGIKALNRSAVLALEDQTGEDEEVPGWALAAVLAFAFTLGIGLFFIMPLFATRPLEGIIHSEPVVNLIEGLIRLAVLVLYIGAIGLLRDIRRLFAYHGAEHMAVHTHEAGLPLEVSNVRKFPTAHPRCGTAFLLTVMVVAILVLAFTGREPLWWLILSPHHLHTGHSGLQLRSNPIQRRPPGPPGDPDDGRTRSSAPETHDPPARRRPDRGGDKRHGDGVGRRRRTGDRAAAGHGRRALRRGVH